MNEIVNNNNDPSTKIPGQINSGIRIEDDVNGDVLSSDDLDCIDDSTVDVSVKCTFCPLNFTGKRDEVEDELFDHIWSKHSEEALDYILNNMYIPDDLKVEIFNRLGMEYVSWIVDMDGEVE